MPISDQVAGLAAQDSVFVARIKTAFLKSCPAIQFESIATNNHLLRLQLVGRILRSPDDYAARCATLVAVDSTVAAQATLAAATDAQIESAVNALLDMLALQGQ